MVENPCRETTAISKIIFSLIMVLVGTGLEHSNIRVLVRNVTEIPIKCATKTYRYIYAPRKYTKWLHNTVYIFLIFFSYELLLKQMLFGNYYFYIYFICVFFLYFRAVFFFTLFQTKFFMRLHTDHNDIHTLSVFH